MRRILNFMLGFVIGSLLGATIALLATPKNGQTLRALYQDAYQNRKAELGQELNLKT